MTYRTILVQLDVESPVTPRLMFGMVLADRFEADIIAFAAAEVPFVVSDEDGMGAGELLQQKTEQIGERLKAMREEFLGVVGDSERFAWRGEVGNPANLVALNARAADLIVTGNPNPDLGPGRHATIDPSSLILSAGRPVLFAADDLRPVQAKRVLLAWKDTREARRAVADSMPFLTEAEEVVVTTIVQGDQKAERDNAADVVRFLMRHGAKARADILGTGTTEVEDALSRIAQSVGADLIVSGAYGHSRLRQWVFGGVTRSLLSDGSLHRLMSN
ncbi:universal stress protein [Pseudaminobacter sp. 19-2017]|uniref:Universal stress protein n=1 Tax=Pseudaminobacter soli (ex Zhang et al. 2022) TaxID=2831468 RepID=A0A942E1V8_9HYPH|nr:universal stress protein [Pseudaminobacter soli]MBS3651583.1 universal stress protein [Pseudaminobacter soli]